MAAAPPDYQIDGGNIGNLSLLSKRLLWRDRCSAVSTGFGLNLPTGSDAVVRISPFVDAVEIKVDNEAVHIMPFLAYSARISRQSFGHMAVQLDVPVNGNRVTARDAAGLFAVGDLADQTLLYVDVSLGRWLYDSECRSVIRRVAGIVELHYTTSLDSINFVPLPPLFGAIFSANAQLDVLNVTAGAHAEVANNTDLRVAAVLPIRDDEDRFFDAEVNAALIHRF